ncbi:MAG: cytochrome d ubiquinol oxidase subunit II [Coriobacteriales bacterium]|jgi:cytochrome d ubiquinol oxidase subunit II|nr:cytochrome d ubiquinol oxidase subunit II [Coriobacteriales bacterium]
MDATMFQVLWFWLIALLIGGYFVLDGFDLGVGVLYPFLAKNEKEKAVLRRSVGPVWDGNEVWLLTAGGALFAAFPPAYATTFSGFYLAIMLVLFGLIVRAVSLEFRAHDGAWKKIWDACFFIGSFLPALLFGVAAGNVLQGIPMHANGDYAGIPLLGLLSPFTLLCGVLGLLLFITLGARWVALKAPEHSALQARAAQLALPLQLGALVVFVVASIVLFVVVQPELAGSTAVLRIVFAVLFVGGLLVSLVLHRKSDLLAFLSQAASVFFLVALWASSLFPSLVVATKGGAEAVGESITIMNGSSSEFSLMCMTIIACIGVPIVLVYHVIIYRSFRGRIADKDLASY